MGRTPRWTRYLSALGCLLGPLVLLPGCQVVGGSRSSQDSDRESPRRPAGDFPAGVYQGALKMEGGEIPAALELIPSGRRDLRGLLQAESGLMAEGAGRRAGKSFHLELVYGGECPGRMTLDGEWAPETESVLGVVWAIDCTGAAEGTFRFSAGRAKSPGQVAEGVP
jgi:hypothetical protein